MDESEGSLGETNEETSGDDGGIVVDDQATCQDRVAVEDGEGHVADGVVDQSGWLQTGSWPDALS